MPTTSPGALDTMRILAKSRPLRSLKAGEVIFRSGELGDCLYGVVEGSVKLAWDSDGSFETIEAGSCLGVGALWIRSIAVTAPPPPSPTRSCW
jgi:CRP-like cAMP-binding protein